MKDMGFILGLVTGPMLGTVILAVFLCFSVSVVAKFTVPFRWAYLSTLASCISCWVVACFCGYAAGFVAAIGISSLVNGQLIRHPKTGPVGLRKGLVISLFQLFALVAICAVVVGLAAGVAALIGTAI
jgi:hypothetical protein